MHFLLQNQFLGPKVHFEPKMHFWRKKWLLGEKCDFEQKVHFGTLTNSHTCYLFCHLATMTPKKAIFAPKITFGLQNRFFAFFAILGPKVHFLRKSALLRPHAADAYKPNGILIKMELFLAQKRFWAEKCILGSKIDFGAQNAKMAPKCIFGPKSAFFAKVTKKLTTASACRIQNRDSRIRARTASTGGWGSWNM